MAEKKRWFNFFGGSKKIMESVPVSPIDLLTNSFNLQALMGSGMKGNFKEESRILDYLFQQINPNILQRDQYYRMIKGLRSNEPLFGAAVRTYLAECLTPGVNKDSVLEVHSDDEELKKDVEALIASLGIDTSFLFNFYKTILVKGDAFLRIRKNKNKNNEEDKYSLELIDPTLVKYPLQFTLSEVLNDPTLNFANTLLSNLPSGLLGSVSSAEGLKQYILNWYNSDERKGIDCSNFNLGTLLIDGTYLAPWECIRGKDLGAEMVYFPFSECFLHNAISPSLDLSQKKLLATIARMANIPIEKWTQKEKIGRRPEESDSRAMSLSNKLSGSLINQEQYNRDSGVGRRIFVPDDWDFEMISPNLNVDNIADVEFAQKEVAIASSIPLTHLLADEFTGSSGVALAKQHKPFRDKAIMFQLCGILALTSVFEIILTETGKLAKGKSFSLSAYLPSLDSDRDETMSAQLDSYLGFLEKVAVVSGYASVSELPKELKLKVLDDLYHGKHKDTVYNIIKNSLDGSPEKVTDEPVTLASVTGSSTTPTMKEMFNMKSLLEEDLKKFRGGING